MGHAAQTAAPFCYDMRAGPALIWSKYQKPASMAMRTSSERLPAPVLVMTLAR